MFKNPEGARPPPMPTPMGIAVRDRMFLRMQNFDSCPNLIKFYPNLPKRIAEVCSRIFYIPSSYAAEQGYNRVIAHKRSLELSVVINLFEIRSRIERRYLNFIPH